MLMYADAYASLWLLMVSLYNLMVDNLGGELVGLLVCTLLHIS